MGLCSDDIFGFSGGGSTFGDTDPFFFDRLLCLTVSFTASFCVLFATFAPFSFQSYFLVVFTTPPELLLFLALLLILGAFSTTSPSLLFTSLSSSCSSSLVSGSRSSSLAYSSACRSCGCFTAASATGGTYVAFSCMSCRDTSVMAAACSADIPLSNGFVNICSCISCGEMSFS